MIPRTRRAPSPSRAKLLALVARAFFLLLAGAPPAFADDPPGDPPNILLVIADDLDPDHLGFCGNALAKTPNLDRLASQSVSFSVLRVQPVCRSTLATLLSGRWPHQTGIVNNLGESALAASGALPERLRERGYATYCGGKFWEGDHHAYGFTDPEVREERFAREKNGQDELFRFLERHREEPWFVWWAPSLPHVPHRAPSRFVSAFQRAAVPVRDGVSDREGYVAAERALLAMEAWLDDELGKLVAKLDELGEYEDTLVVFLADNGWSTALSSKGTPFEKGIRSPLLVALPGERRARRVEALVDVVDVNATLLEYAGVAADGALHGRSLRRWLEGGSGPVREVLCGIAYCRDPDAGSGGLAYALHARDARWKYVLYLKELEGNELGSGGKLAPPLRAHAGQEALFDLAADPFELRDLSAHEESGERMRSLRDSALEWLRASDGSELAASVAAAVR